MTIADLPIGDHPAAIEYPYFPTRWQHVLWRNWGLVSKEKLADILSCSVEELCSSAAGLGLNINCPVPEKWKTNGYLTLIRNNWQLLNYPQLLKLLDWSVEQLAYTLKEEDFMYVKMGYLKPDCPEVKYTQLSPEEQQKTAKLKETLLRHFPNGLPDNKEMPFAFADNYCAKPKIGNSPKFDFNFVHAYAANCGDVLFYADVLDPLPENLLAQYQSMGIKGVWFHSLLYLLCPIPGAEEYSSGYEKRIKHLKELVNRCAKYDIKIYLYMNEPRCMPLDFYEKKPLWAGVEEPALETRCICTTSSSEPLEYLENACYQVFTQAKGLGGVLTITQSENPTNCHTHLEKDKCPSCRNVAPEKIIADVNHAIGRGIHRADPEAKLLIYDWAWQREKFGEQTSKHTGALAECTGAYTNLDFKRDVIANLPKDSYLNCVSEWGTVFEIDSTKTYLTDYSISHGLPSEESLASWEAAGEYGLKKCAKVQANNSWELSAVPYIPVPYLIQEHFEKLQAAGVNGIMLSWTLGGYPGGNLELLNASPEEIANYKYHPQLAEEVCRAQKQFSEAFKEYPFSSTVAYNCPSNYGPMNVLHLKPTGYLSTMIGFPHDDIDGWRGAYSEETLEKQFRLLSEKWQIGLDILDAASGMVKENEKAEFDELYTMAKASYCHLRSTYLQTAFTRLRNAGTGKADMLKYAREELVLAKELHDIVLKDSRIGFEASNHYYYTVNDLREKIINCEYVIEALS